jgi:hypothetical protein
MAKKTLLTIDGAYRKVKKGFVTIDGTYRNTPKVFITIGGVYRPCWGGGKLNYYGRASILNNNVAHLSATTVGNYAIFSGGYNYATDGDVATMQAYNASLVKSAVSSEFDLSDSAATTVGDYAIFGGGWYRSIAWDSSDSLISSSYTLALNSSLTWKNSSSLSVGRYFLAATTVGNYALFGGGNSGLSYNATTTVDAYNTSLTRTTPTALSQARYILSATAVGKYALFGGGLGNRGVSIYATDAYDESLVKTIPSVQICCSHGSATTVGKYALFAGSSGGTQTVEVYDSSLTKITSLSLSVSRVYTAATTIGDYALFGGGGNSPYYNTVDAFDDSLTRTAPTVLSLARGYLAASTVGNYALFAGGASSNSASTNRVDAYTII